MLKRFSAPMSVFLSVTNACNLRCIYCSTDAKTPFDDELSLEEFYQLIEEFKTLGIFQVTVTGGEPFMRRDVFLILKKLVEDRTAEQLVDLNLKTIQISLDAASPEINDASRGPAAFRRSLRGIKTLLKHGIHPGILVTVTRLNYDQVEMIVEKLKDWDVQWVAFNLVAAVGRGVCTYNELTLSPQQLIEFAGFLKQVKPQHQGFVKEEILYWLSYPGRLEQYSAKPGTEPAAPRMRMLPCGAARSACAISADGWVIPCNKFSDYRCGNVRHESLKEIWNGSRMESIRALAEKPTAEVQVCRSCRYNPICAGGCRAEAYLRFRNLEAPDPACAILSDSAIHDLVRPIALVNIGR
jgi:radical SAM protein with 4Fe4S-binding SPASM domain